MFATACNPDRNKLQIASAGADSALKMRTWSVNAETSDPTSTRMGSGG